MSKVSSTISIYRWETGGTFTSLVEASRTFTTPGTVTFVGVTNGSQVDLTCTPTGAATVTYSDTSGSRFTDGRVGVHMYCDNINVAYIDDLLVTGTPLFIAAANRRLSQAVKRAAYY